MIKIISKVLKCSKGATAMEYGLIAALISVSMILVVSNLGTEISSTLGVVDTELGETNSGTNQ